MRARWPDAPSVGVVTATGLLLMGLVAVVTTTGLSQAADLQPAQPVATGCAAQAPTTAAGYQEMFDAKNDRSWPGGDQAASIGLPDGRTAWLFADTVQGEQAPDGGYGSDGRMVHNSMLLQDGGCLTAVPGPEGRELIPSRSDGSYFWPMQAVLDGNQLVVFAQRVAKTGDGPFDFATVGMSSAVFALDGAVPRLDSVSDLPTSSADEADPAYGVAAVTVGGHHYLYGTAEVEAPLTFGKAVYVARVPVGQLGTADAWRFWTGSAWSAAAADAHPIVDAAPAGWSTSFSVHAQFDGSVRMVTKENEFLGTDLITGVAAAPTGPFTRQVVAQAPSYTSPGELAYTALAHPGVGLAGGQLLVTYSRNNEDLAVVFGDADYYKPQFLAVSLT